MSQSTSSSNSRVPRNQDSGITKESLAENMNSLVNTVGDLSQIVAELATIVHADISASHEYKKLHIERLEASSNNDIVEHIKYLLKRLSYTYASTNEVVTSVHSSQRNRRTPF